MIKISVKGLAKFMVSTDAQRRKVLKDFKNPDPEGIAQAMYYKEARDIVEAYHKKGYETSWLREKSDQLRTFATLVSGQTTTRYRHNARAIDQYSEHFGNKTFQVFPIQRLSRDFGQVRVTALPDLHVKERNREKIIKFEFGVDEPLPRVPKIISQLMFEAATSAGMGLKSSDVLYIDVPRGVIHRGARVGSRMKSEIEAACKNIASMWPGI